MRNHSGLKPYSGHFAWSMPTTTSSCMKLRLILKENHGTSRQISWDIASESCSRHSKNQTELWSQNPTQSYQTSTMGSILWHLLLRCKFNIMQNFRTLYQTYSDNFPKKSYYENIFRKKHGSKVSCRRQLTFEPHLF